MMSNSKQRTVCLGSEYDPTIRVMLRDVLSELGASQCEKIWGIGGSQEIETATVDIEGRKLIIEAETYIGLTITGDDDLVGLVAKRVADLEDSKNEGNE